MFDRINFMSKRMFNRQYSCSSQDSFTPSLASFILKRVYKKRQHTEPYFT